MEEQVLVGRAADSWLATFLLQPRTACPGNGATHSGLGPSTSINNKDSTPTDTDLIWKIPQLRLPSKVACGGELKLVKLTSG